jgi:addiction module HigA family antidote
VLTTPPLVAYNNTSRSKWQIQGKEQRLNLNRVNCANSVDTIEEAIKTRTMKYITTEDITAAEWLLSPPGDTLLETLAHKGISQAEFAESMGISLEAANELLTGKTSITPEIAMLLEKVVGVPAGFWMERERNYEEELKAIIKGKEEI